jgi:putative transposase
MRSRSREENVCFIAYDKLVQPTGSASYDALRQSHYNLVNESVVTNANCREAWWSESVAVGSDSFVENIKRQLGLRAKGRKVKEIGEGYQLREAMQSYISVFEPQISHIELENTYCVGNNDDNTAR